MARPQIVTNEQIERCAALYSAGAHLGALADEYGVTASTLRHRIRRRFGALPQRLPPSADSGVLLRAASLLDSIATQGQSDEVRNMAREVRSAAAAADATNRRLVEIALGGRASE